MGEDQVEKRPCLWRTSDGRCANCKARRFRHDALGMKDDYGECESHKDYSICVFYKARPMHY